MSHALSLKTLLAVCLLGVMAVPAASAEEIDPMDPWQEDRAAHQENIDAQYEKYQERWPEYYKERYTYDGVGVLNKEEKRKAREEAEAPVDLSEDAAVEDASDE